MRREKLGDEKEGSPYKVPMPPFEGRRKASLKRLAQEPKKGTLLLCRFPPPEAHQSSRRQAGFSRESPGHMHSCHMVSQEQPDRGDVQWESEPP
jgi:hypothetical protein